MSSESTPRPLIPRLRFPEFADAGEWELKQLDAILSYERPDKFIVSDTNYVSNGTPVLTANKSFVLGYTEENYGIFLDIPVIIFDDFTTDKKYVDFPFKVKSSAIKILRNKEENNLRLIFEIMCEIKFNPSEHKRYYISEYQNLSISLPSLAEQQKIADCLSSLDALIAAQGHQLDALKAHKRGLMQQLFPTAGETVPRLRFPEFADAGEWELKRLIDVTFFVNERTALKNISLAEYVSTENILPDYAGITIASKLPPAESVSAFKASDILISNIRPYLRKVWFSNKSGGASNDIIIVRPSDEINTIFLSFILKNDTFIEYMMSGAKGVKMPRGDIASIKEYPLAVPTLSEQQKIADCLTALDGLIGAQGQRLDALKQFKRGLMQQLFPAAEED